MTRLVALVSPAQVSGQSPAAVAGWALSAEPALRAGAAAEAGPMAQVNPVSPVEPAAPSGGPCPDA